MVVHSTSAKEHWILHELTKIYIKFMPPTQRNGWFQRKALGSREKRCLKGPNPSLCIAPPCNLHEPSPTCMSWPRQAIQRLLKIAIPQRRQVHCLQQQQLLAFDAEYLLERPLTGLRSMTLLECMRNSGMDDGSSLLGKCTALEDVQAMAGLCIKAGAPLRSPRLAQCTD